MQVMLADLMVCSDDSPLEQREHAFDCIRVNRRLPRFCTGIFARAVIHRIVRVELPFEIVVGKLSIIIVLDGCAFFQRIVRRLSPVTRST